jgi:DNA-binding CsgD family transcriptional regulator
MPKHGTKSGKPIGRAPLARKLKDQITKRMASGATCYRIAKDLGIDRHTVKKYAA